MGQTPTRTPTPTLGMRLSCNFVNVYTIAYRVQYTFTRVHASIPNGHPRDDPRAEVGEDVRVGVGVRVGPMEFKLIQCDIAFRFRTPEQRVKAVTFDVCKNPLKLEMRGKA